MKCLKHTVLIFLFISIAFPSHGGQQSGYNYYKKLFLTADSQTFKDSVLRYHLAEYLDTMRKEDAVHNWNELLVHCNENRYHDGSGFCNYNLGLRLNLEGEYFESYLAFQDSKNSYATVNNQYGLACVYNGMGNLFSILYKFDQALKSYKESAKLFREINNPVYGTIYLNIGGILVRLNSLGEAKSYLESSRTILSQQKDTSGLVNCYINLSEVFLALNNTDSAFYFLMKSNELIKGNVEVGDKFNTLLNLGTLYLENNKAEQAQPFLTEAYFLAENEPHAIPIESRAKAIKALSEWYDITGDTETAHNLIKSYVKYETESKRVQSNLDLSRLEFESLERERIIEKKRKTYILYTSLILLISSMLMIFTFYRSYKHKKRANLLLTEMDQLKTQLYSNITHEFRTPLTLILGPLEQMLSSGSEQVANRKQVKLMQKSARGMLKLVNEMLDLAKLDAKSLKLEIKKEDVSKFIRTRFAAFESTAAQKNIDFKIAISDDSYTAFFDASKLEKIIYNLLSNAVKFTPKCGYIICTASFSHGKSSSVEIIVENSGEGIPSDELNKIFNRFHQVPGTEKYSSAGTGIGLSLVHELTTLMHGEVHAESEPDLKTLFRVYIPLGTDHLKPEEYTLIQAKPNPATKLYIPEEDYTDSGENKNTSLKTKNSSPQVLIVEDQAEIKEFIAENLYEDYLLQMAENGAMAYKTAVETIPDLIVTDVAMPVMDGMELCAKLKTDERTSHIPVIMLTGKSTLKDKLTGLETGADAYLTKPFHIGELKLRISKLIEQRQKLRERFSRNLNIEPKELAVTSADERFLIRALEIIEANMANSEFEVAEFQKELLMSRTQLFRKIKAMTNQTPGEFIRTIRLKRAARLIEQNFGNVAQVAFEVGFNNPSYFAKCFRELFGKLPSEFKKTD